LWHQQWYLRTPRFVWLFAFMCWKRSNPNCNGNSPDKVALRTTYIKNVKFKIIKIRTSYQQGCGVGPGVVRSRRFSGGVGFLITLGVGVRFFFRLRLRMSYWIIFYITLQNWEFLLKWYHFFWNFCWNRDLLLCTTIYIDFNSQISFSLCWGVGVGNFGQVGESESDTLPQTPQPWLSVYRILSLHLKHKLGHTKPSTGPHAAPGLDIVGKE